jgi:hypothetical protein
MKYAALREINKLLSSTLELGQKKAITVPRLQEAQEGTELLLSQMAFQ